MEIKDMIAVLEAHEEGKKIECRALNPGSAWVDALHVDVRNDFDFTSFDYRVKPEPPKPREWWIAYCPKHGNRKVVTHFQPSPECDYCEIVRVREVLDEEHEQTHQS